jgi:UDP-N-acetylmuramate dehydrogenase
MKGLESEDDRGACLSDWTTFGVPASLERLVHCRSVEQVRGAIVGASARGDALHVLGGGSNILPTRDVEGTVLRVAIEGVECIDGAPSGQVRIKVGAGCVWHGLVMHSLEQGWSGLENLALIPGSVGAAPMQNIGAYGVELEQRFAWLEAVEVSTGSLRRFDYADCGFSYRESVFKRALLGQFVITHVALDLLLEPELCLDYGAIGEGLTAAGVGAPTPRDVAEVVMAIRREKLPDPAVLGNAGSFFKNPVLSQSAFDRLKKQHPAVPSYDAPSGVKVAAGWLIEQAGWKGHDRGTYGVHDKQALVLVNRGGASGRDILQLSEEVLQGVFAKFGVQLEREVNIW